MVSDREAIAIPVTRIGSHASWPSRRLSSSASTRWATDPCKRPTCVVVTEWSRQANTSAAALSARSRDIVALHRAPQPEVAAACSTGVIALFYCPSGYGSLEFKAPRHARRTNTLGRPGRGRAGRASSSCAWPRAARLPREGSRAPCRRARAGARVGRVQAGSAR